jgi:Spy/CpxP family protein refolding chaperone
MKLFSGLALGAVLVVLSASVLPAQDQPKKRDTTKQPGRGGAFQPGDLAKRFSQAALLSPEAIEKLKFTDEQKKKFDKLAEEFTDKQKETMAKVLESVQGGDPAKVREALQGVRTDVEKLRTDTLAKVEGLLTAEQKKVFEEVKQQPRRFGDGTFPRRGQPGAAPVGDVLSKPAQEKLKLTDDQKKKLDELQKEVESKLKGILTEEQKKQLEDLKKEATTPENPPRTRPGRTNPNL